MKIPLILCVITIMNGHHLIGDLVFFFYQQVLGTLLKTREEGFWVSFEVDR